MLYLKLYIWTVLKADDVDIMSIDNQKLDIIEDLNLWYRELSIWRGTTQFYMNCQTNHTVWTIQDIVIVDSLLSVPCFVMLFLKCLF